MTEPTMIVYGYVERETVTNTLRTRLFHLTEDVQFETPDGTYEQVQEGALLLVVDRAGVDSALADLLLERADLVLHHFWSAHHSHAATRTPLDLRTPEYGGRETNDIPF